MEPVGLAIGILGIAGLFKSCIDNFDIIVKAREFGTDFDLLCTQLSLQRIRLVLWGETLGLAPGSSTPFNPLLNRQDITPSIESTLCHLQILLQKADVVTDRYELQGDEADQQGVADLHSHQPAGLNIFRERLELLKSQLRKNQNEKSTWKVTKWAVHDLAGFKEVVSNIRELMDGLEGITSTLGVLRQQQVLLENEIDSVSDTQSLRLLQQLAFSDGASMSLRLVSDIASMRLSLLDGTIPDGTIRSTPTSYYTAISHFGEKLIQRDVIFEDVEDGCPQTFRHDMRPVYPIRAVDCTPGTAGRQQQQQQQQIQRNKHQLTRVKQRVEGLPILFPFTRIEVLPTKKAFFGRSKPTRAVKEATEPVRSPIKAARTSTAAAIPAPVVDPERVPQNQRLMAEVAKHSTNPTPGPSFQSGATGYGDALALIKARNDEIHSGQSIRLLMHADKDNGTSAARRAFIELRSLRTAGVPFITASLVDDRLDRLIANIEGPPDTPYQGGVFWILVKLPSHPSEPPTLQFVTKIYHPNIDCNGNICADYQSWWKDPNLQRYMNGLTLHGQTTTPWFAGSRFSLGALLTALCSLLASPNASDPLVPEIAATYLQDHASYCYNARLYTQQFAKQERPSDSDLQQFERETETAAFTRRSAVSHDGQTTNTGCVASSAINRGVEKLQANAESSILSNWDTNSGNENESSKRPKSIMFQGRPVSLDSEYNERHPDRASFDTTSCTLGSIDSLPSSSNSGPNRPQSTRLRLRRKYFGRGERVRLVDLKVPPVSMNNGNDLSRRD